MEYNYDQLNIGFVEPRKTSFFTKLTAFLLITAFVSIPLSQITPDFKHCITVYTNGCLGIMPIPKCFCF